MTDRASTNANTDTLLMEGSSGMEKNIRPVRKWRVKCFELADRWLDRLIRFMRATHECFWLGCLSADDLNAVTEAHFGESQSYASREHNLSGFFSWETSALHHYFRPGSRILLAAAGGGREVIALRKAGFDAEGFECNLPLVRASQTIFDQVGEPRYVTLCDPDSVPPGPPAYDGLIVGWTAYTHILTKLRRIAFLQALRQRALQHSPLLVSFFARSSSRDEAIVYRMARLCRFFLRGRREPLELGDRLSYARYVHAFASDELQAELNIPGFQVVHCSIEGNSGQAVGVAE